MQYIALDTETTGLSPKDSVLLQLAMIVGDTEDTTTPVEDLPTFYAAICPDRLMGDLVAFGINSRLISYLAQLRKKNKFTDGYCIETYCANVMATYTTMGRFTEKAMEWLKANTRKEPHLRIQAGCNPAFDSAFLPTPLAEMFHFRMIDAGSMAMGRHRHYWNDTVPPGQSQLVRTAVEHDALADARNVVRIIREHMPPA